jgi:hypothetical protein
LRLRLMRCLKHWLVRQWRWPASTMVPPVDRCPLIPSRIVMVIAMMGDLRPVAILGYIATRLA